MERRTATIITIVAAILCGCPGLFALCWGALAAMVAFIPGSNIDIGGSSSPQSALITGLGSLCAGIIFIAIPVVVGFLLLRNKSVAASPVTPPTPPVPPSEPLPPAS